MRAVFRPEVAGRRACSSRSVRRCRENRCFHRRALLQGPCVFAFQMGAALSIRCGFARRRRGPDCPAGRGRPVQRECGRQARSRQAGLHADTQIFALCTGTGGIWQDSRAGCNKTLAELLRTMRVYTGMLPGLPEPSGRSVRVQTASKGCGAGNVAVGAGVPRHSRAVFGNFLLDSAARAC